MLIFEQMKVVENLFLKSYGENLIYWRDLIML